ncbi:unnamed protein product [Cyprideis torosa]|uniref:Uncharacterized protein n=1 Tax=Cyprideis torosa TaxID=163714 RepID=A0A7R8WUP3_9CRUS|nr:unnamed protein product [Cyprideis torosa]CAG0910750.1 unnamed protein product [Cyprideis torosa]
MGMRRKAREAAMQFLFQEDHGVASEFSPATLAGRFDTFCELYQVGKKSRGYALHLIEQTLTHQGEIDDYIRAAAKNWRLERLACTDRNLLRLCVGELLYGEDVPSQVAINEAVEIAKRYGSGDSPAFVNGILDTVQKTIAEKCLS